MYCICHSQRNIYKILALGLKITFFFSFIQIMIVKVTLMDKIETSDVAYNPGFELGPQLLVPGVVLATWLIKSSG